MFRETADRFLQCLVVALGVLALLAGDPANARSPKPTAVPRLRLYVMDCGTIAAMDAALYGLKAE